MAKKELTGREYVGLNLIGEKCDALSLLNVAIAFRSHPNFKAKKLEVATVGISKSPFHSLSLSTEAGEYFQWEFVTLEENAEERRMMTTERMDEDEQSLNYIYHITYDSHDAFKIGQMTVTNGRRELDDDYYVRSHCEDPRAAFQFVLSVMFDIYDIKVLHFDCNSVTDMSTHLPNLVFDNADMILVILVSNEATPNDNQEALDDNSFKFLMTNMRPKDSLYLTCNYANRNHGLHFNFNLNTLKIRNASFFTGADLLQLNSQNILVSGTEIEGHVMNQFIKFWLNGGYSQIEQMTIQGFTDIESILKDIDTLSLSEILNKKNLESIEFENYSAQCAARAGYLIRDDGKTATIDIIPTRGNLGSCHFIVWNETVPLRTLKT